jgi:hypothetical protein
LKFENSRNKKTFTESLHGLFGKSLAISFPRGLKCRTDARKTAQGRKLLPFTLPILAQFCVFVKGKKGEIFIYLNFFLQRFLQP